MSTEHSPVLIVGFLIDAETFLKPLLKEIPEESHLEDRWDPNTGKKLKPVKVVDKSAGEYYVYDGIAYGENEGQGDIEELMDALSSEFGCAMYLVGYMGFIEDCKVAINLVSSPDDFAPFGAVVRASKKVAALEKRLKRAGFDPGKPGVWADKVVA